tara:strand:+ start:255 stop:1958 length:1704 start_codon:yes stop_codon:yes gene_type:complete
MTQADFTIANQTFPNTRTELNTSLQALATNSAGNDAPSTTFPSQWWFDSDGNQLYIRNKDNDAWVKVFTIGATSDKIDEIGADSFRLSGTTPTLFIGDGGAEDCKIVFDSNGKDFYVALDDSEDKLIIGEGSTVGTNPILTITDDSVTIGDGAAVDTKIVFDGNAQDYYVGLDDSADDLIIGKGSTVGTTPAITVNEDLQTTIANHANPKSAFRNHIINGDFCVWQRKTSDTTISDGSNEGYNSADRWQMTFGSSAGGAVVWNRSQVVPAEQGFEYALKISPSSTTNCTGSQEVRFSTTLEAQMFPDLSYGTSAAKNMMLSFWFKTNKVGLYSVYFEHSGTGTAKRKYVTFTPAQSDTWERIELLVTGDTSTAFPINVSTRGITIAWYLDNTPNLDSANAEEDWGTAVLVNSSNNVNFMDNTSNELYITGVQLEVADKATDFEYLPYDVVLNRCYRYTQRHPAIDPTSGSGFCVLGSGHADNSTVALCQIVHYIPMRADVTATQSGTLRIHRAGAATDTYNVAIDDNTSSASLSNFNCTSSGFSASDGVLLEQSNDTDAHILLSAEL